MSVRAYKLIEIKTKPDPTFNCWHNEQVFDLANLSQYGEGGGQISFDRETVQEVLDDKDSGMTEESNEILRNILKDMDKEDYVEYYCF